MDEIETLRAENKRLHALVAQLRKELEVYRYRDRSRYDHDGDYVPYHEEDRD